MVHLSYVDFLEAIVRLATMKGMPTDEEIEAANCLDAGHFIHFQRSSPAPPTSSGSTRMRTGMRCRAARERCVEHLISLILPRSRAASARCTTRSSPSEATKFMQREPAPPTRSSIPGEAKAARSVQAALESGLDCQQHDFRCARPGRRRGRREWPAQQRARRGTTTHLNCCVRTHFSMFLCA